MENDELDQRIAVALYGEIYNLNWISKATMNNFIGALKAMHNDNSYVLLLQPLLKVCSTKLAVQGSKNVMMELRDEMKKISKKEDRESHLKFVVQDCLSMINYVVAILEQFEVKVSEPRLPLTEEFYVIEKMTIDNLYRGMSEEAYVEVINDIKSNKITNVAEFIEKLIEKAIATCASLIAKATRDLSSPYMKEMLSNKCHSIFLDYVKDTNKCGSTLRLLHYIGELYNFDVLSNEFINLCFEILFEQQNELGTTGISALLRCVGLKMETANTEKIDGYFEFFDHVVKTEYSKRTKVFKKLITLRANEWSEQGIQHSYEDFLMLYTIENATSDEIVTKFSNHVEIEKFIYALWKVALKDPHPSYALLCKQLTKLCPEFNQELIEFIELRCRTFANLESEHYNETVNSRLGKVSVFVAELFQLNIIPDYVFENWVEPKLASKIPHSYILAISSLVSHKVMQKSSNERLKTLVINLDHINEDKSQHKWNTICGDMQELKETLMGLKNLQRNQK